MCIYDISETQNIYSTYKILVNKKGILSENASDDNGCVITVAGNKSPITLNGTSLQLFKLCKKYKKISTILASFAHMYEKQKKEIVHDVLSSITALAKSNIVFILNSRNKSVVASKVDGSWAVETEYGTMYRVNEFSIDILCSSLGKYIQKKNAFVYLDDDLNVLKQSLQEIYKLMYKKDIFMYLTVYNYIPQTPSCLILEKSGEVCKIKGVLIDSDIEEDIVDIMTLLINNVSEDRVIQPVHGYTMTKKSKIIDKIKLNNNMKINKE